MANNGIMWTKIEETSTTGYMPTNAANTWSTGVNSADGTVEFLQLRYDLTFADSPVATGDVLSLIQSMRIICNGEQVMDFTAAFAQNNAITASQLGYLLNHIGGRAVEEAGDAAATRVGYINIPLGLVCKSGTNRWEIIIEWAAAAQAISSGTMSYWLRYNSNVAVCTRICPATSFLSTSGAYEQVILRIPQNVPSSASLLGFAVLNERSDPADATTTPLDQINSQGIRVNALSQYGVPLSMWRMQNGDLQNGIMYNAGNDGTELQAFASRAKGSIFIPTYGLSGGGDVPLSVGSSAATTRRYIPVLTWNIGSTESDTNRQTQPVLGDTRRATLSGNLK